MNKTKKFTNSEELNKALKDNLIENGETIVLDERQKTTDQLKKEFDDFVNKEYADFSRELMLYTNRRTMQILQRCFNKKIEIENKIKEASPSQNSSKEDKI